MLDGLSLSAGRRIVVNTILVGFNLGLMFVLAHPGGAKVTDRRGGGQLEYSVDCESVARQSIHTYGKRGQSAEYF